MSARPAAQQDHEALLDEVAAQAELTGADGEIGVEAGRAVVKVAAVEHGVVQVDELGDVQAAGKGL